MRPAGEYMNDFMDKLKKGDFDKDYQTNNGPEINEEFASRSFFTGFLPGIHEIVLLLSRESRELRNSEASTRG